MTLYEIDTDDVDAVHDRLLEASRTGELQDSETAVLGPVTYWDLDADITPD